MKLNKRNFDKILADWAEENRVALDRLAYQPGKCITFSRLQALADSRDTISADEEQHLQQCRRCGSALRAFQTSYRGMDVLDIKEKCATVKGAEYLKLSKASTVTIYDSDSGKIMASARVNRDKLIKEALPEVSLSPIGKVSIPLDESLPAELVRSDRVKLGKIMLRVQ